MNQTRIQKIAEYKQIFDIIMSDLINMRIQTDLGELVTSKVKRSEHVLFIVHFTADWSEGTVLEVSIEQNDICGISVIVDASSLEGTVSTVCAVLKQVEEAIIAVFTE